MPVREFVIKIREQQSGRVREYMVRKVTFAEAATDAYRYCNNLQFGTVPQGNWKIESIAEHILTGT